MTSPAFKTNLGFLPPDRLEFALGLTVRGRLKGFVYQQVDPRFANAATLWDKRRQKRRLVIGANPQTPAQTVQRSKFQRAVSAWQALSAEEKLEYNRIRGRKKYRHRFDGVKTYFSGYNYFISVHIRGEI